MPIIIDIPPTSEVLPPRPLFEYIYPPIIKSKPSIK